MGLTRIAKTDPADVFHSSIVPSNWNGIVARARRRAPSGPAFAGAVSFHSARLRGSFLAPPLPML
jgi:hypothetical protein